MDLQLINDLDGGDFVLVEVEDEIGVFYDIALDGGMSTAIFISHFGGNVEASTTGNEAPGVIRGDWWGNALIDEPVSQANSSLERALLKLTITSGNLLKFEDFSKADIDWLLDGVASEVDVEASITAPETVKIKDIIKQPNSDTDFVNIWEFDKNRLLEVA